MKIEWYSNSTLVSETEDLSDFEKKLFHQACALMGELSGIYYSRTIKTITFGVIFNNGHKLCLVCEPFPLTMTIGEAEMMIREKVSEHLQIQYEMMKAKVLAFEGVE